MNLVILIILTNLSKFNKYNILYTINKTLLPANYVR